MNPLYVAIIGTWVRAGLLIVSTYLIQHHIVTATQGETLSTMWFDQILNALPGIVALVWSNYDKIWARVKLMTALWLPKGATENAVTAKIATGEPTPSVHTPPDTVPGVPKV